MKTLISLAICIIMITNSFAQTNTGTIYYKETVKLEINLDNLPNMPEEIKAKFPKEQSTDNVLYFNENASLYTGVPKDANNIEYKSDKEDVEIKIQMDAPEHYYYQNLKSKSVVESQDFFGKKFLITGMEKIKWKVTSETKEILGYACTKATAMTKDSMNLEAWFTTAIPTSVGPGKFHYLPGAVLEVQMDGGKRSLVATKVDLGNVDASKIAEPKKGKKVSQEEFRKIVEEKQKEMAAEYGGKGNFIIRTETIEN